MVLQYDVTMIAVGDPVAVLFKLNEVLGSKSYRQRGSRKLAIAVQNKARDLAPRGKTGYLKSSIQARFKGNYSWGVDVDADYGVFVEYGTSKMEAKPFLRPAIDYMSSYGGSVMGEAAWEDKELQALMHTPVVRSLSIGSRIPGIGGWAGASPKGGSGLTQAVLGQSNLSQIGSSLTGSFGFESRGVLTPRFG